MRGAAGLAWRDSADSQEKRSDTKAERAEIAAAGLLSFAGTEFQFPCCISKNEISDKAMTKSQVVAWEPGSISSRCG
ncbi:unnamed protein product [Coccothraustes coccothraustes]